MRRLLVALFIPILSLYFVRVEQFEQLEERVSQLEFQTEVRQETLQETVVVNDEITLQFTVELEFVGDDIYIVSFEICELNDNECEIEYGYELFDGTYEELLQEFYDEIDAWVSFYENYS